MITGTRLPTISVPTFNNSLRSSRESMVYSAASTAAIVIASQSPIEKLHFPFERFVVDPIVVVERRQAGADNTFDGFRQCHN